MANTSIRHIKNRTYGKPLVVQYCGLRALAYRDSTGRLRDFWNQKLLRLPVHILDPED